MIGIRTGGRRLHRRLGGGAVAVAALLVLSACGGASESATTNTAGLTASPIKIGLMADISGPGAGGEASAAKVFQAWASHTNTTGGIAGHPVEVVVKDTKGDSPTAAAAAQDLIDDDSIAAVVSASATTDTAVGQLLSDSGLPVAGGEGYNPEVWGKLKNWFSLTTTFPQVVNMQIPAAKAIGGHTLAVLACSEDPSCVAAVPLFEAAAKQAGTAFAGTVQVSGSAPNYTAECLNLIQHKVDYAQLAVLSSVGSRVATDCQTQGYTGYFGASATSITADLYDTPGIKLAGALNAFPWWVDDAPVKNFRDVMAAEKVDQKDWAQPAATALWATGELFTKALTNAAVKPGDEVNRQTVLAAYGKVSGETLGGLLPQPLTFTADKPSPPINCYWLYQYDNGTFKGQLKPTCPS